MPHNFFLMRLIYLKIVLQNIMIDPAGGKTNSVPKGEVSV